MLAVTPKQKARTRGRHPLLLHVDTPRNTAAVQIHVAAVLDELDSFTVRFRVFPSTPPPSAPPLLNPSLLPHRPLLSKLTMSSGPCTITLKAVPCGCATGQFDPPTADKILTITCHDCRRPLISHEGGAEWVSNLLHGPATIPLS